MSDTSGDNRDNRRTFIGKSSWIETLDVKTIIILLTLMTSLVGSWFTQTARADDQSRRISVLEQQLVPRTEHDIRDAALSERLKNIESRLTEIQSTLDRHP